MKKSSLKATSYAFTLLEILIVMVVIGAMATIIGPRLMRREPRADWPAVLDEFNDLVSFARQEAIATQENYRLYFQSNPADSDFVVVEKEEQDPERPDQKIYKQVSSEYFPTKYELPLTVKMSAFYLGREEQFVQNRGRSYCYVIPNGLVQDVMINIIRYVDTQERRATFKIEPFFGRFDFYEGFVRGVKG